MVRFDDYHRTVICYHGTRLSTALRIANRVADSQWSRQNFDWLGHGVYFWEYAPGQALNFAQVHKLQAQQWADPTPEDHRRAAEPIAVVASMIRLGFCFDLLEPTNLEYLLKKFGKYQELVKLSGGILPRNT